MAVQDVGDVRQPFGAGRRLMETASLLGQRPLLFVGFTIVAGVLLPMVPVLAATGLIVLLDDGQPETLNTIEPILGIIAFILAVLCQFLCIGVLTLAAYDASLETRRPLRTYIVLALRRMLKLALVMLSLGILAGLAYVVFFIVGLWVTAVYAAIMPIVMVEGLGYAAFGRARSLSKTYRWPIVGYLLLVGFIVVAFALVIVAAVAAVAAMGNDTALAIAPLISLLLPPFITIAMCLGSVTVYTRLRDIKEGQHGADISDVFA